jgi:hypothetical protein
VEVQNIELLPERQNFKASPPAPLHKRGGVFCHFGQELLLFLLPQATLSSPAVINIKPLRAKINFTYCKVNFSSSFADKQSGYLAFFL